MPRSILKSSLSTIGPSPPAARSRDDRNRETAIYHAQLIQQQKEVETLILASTEKLLDLPSFSSADPAHPCSTDSELVKSSLRLFQPSDYDSLIEERNINKQCGYVLCPRPNRLQDTQAKYRILYGRGRGPDALKIVERQTLEQWCSDDCGKRALYIKVQLNEEPAWTRSHTIDGTILLLEDIPNHQSGEDGKASQQEHVKSLDLDREEDLAAHMRTLAIERGDNNASSKILRLAELDIREKTITEDEAFVPAPPTTDEVTADSQGCIEGYRPQFSGKKLQEESSDEEDLLETI
ncbi:hypothetical protein JMJ35_006156 [Cladonia borealis]|uniref:RNA polymerase II subunit B1 CTD phosphatase RPAP2 homolog n=1 Tax=Cladonia borealis TaxID=184061 RepID=A0AA39R1G8_9LECA|nr:hypothetical protein JMJ35_006156 [Cladonia borealis]